MSHRFARWHRQAATGQVRPERVWLLLAAPCCTPVWLIVREMVPGMGAAEYNADDAPDTWDGAIQGEVDKLPACRLNTCQGSLGQ